MKRPNLSEIKRRAEAAIEGPWIAHTNGCVPVVTGSSDAWIADCLGDPPETKDKANATFIANARQDIPDLLAYIDHLEAKQKEKPSAKPIRGGCYLLIKGQIRGAIPITIHCEGATIREEFAFGTKGNSSWPIGGYLEMDNIHGGAVLKQREYKEAELRRDDHTVVMRLKSLTHLCPGISEKHLVFWVGEFEEPTP